MNFRLLSVLAALFALGGMGCGHGGSSASQILFLSDRDGDWALYTMDATGGNEHRVLAAGRVDPFATTTGYGEPVLSPDGRKVLLNRRGLTVATLASGATQRIEAGEESSAAWSPDGRRIVFSGRPGKGLYVVDVGTGRRRTLLPASQTSTPAWSPDGKWIAFVRQIGYGPTEVDAAHPDGSEPRRLTPYEPTGALAWSRDGRLAFIGALSGEPAHLVVVDVRGRRVVMQPRLDGGTVAWSPNGRTIAYASATEGSRGPAIYTVAADGTGRRQLTPSQPLYYDESPVWSPDGKSLLFVRAPFAGGAERGVDEVWMMSSDGSHLRPLTEAYPDGGDNLAPAWIRDAVHTEPAPRPQEVRRGKAVVLHLQFAVDGISADGGHAAIAPVAHQTERGLQPTPPILLWRPGRGESARLVASPCGGVEQLVLSGSRLAFDCSQESVDTTTQSLWVFDLRTRAPHEVFFGHGGPGGGRIELDHIVGGGGLLAFGSERVDAGEITPRRTLWRIDGFERIALTSGSDTGDVVAAGGGRLAVELADGRVAILGTDGALMRALPLTRHQAVLVAPYGVEGKPPFLLAGSDLLLLEDGRLRAYDTATGNLRWARRVPAGAQLEAANERFVVYTAGSSIHVLSRGSERVIRTDARPLRDVPSDAQRLVHAALTADGLYYCFDVADRRYPGRVVFVPRRALPR